MAEPVAVDTLIPVRWCPDQAVAALYADDQLDFVRLLRLLVHLGCAGDADRDECHRPPLHQEPALRWPLAAGWVATPQRAGCLCEQRHYSDSALLRRDPIPNR